MKRFKRVYLDTSAYHRPYDDQNQAKIYQETQAVLRILELIESKQLEAVNSDVLVFEIQQNPFPIKRKLIELYLNQCTVKQPLTETIRQRAKQLEYEGIKTMDALHVSSFEISQSDYFITCDQRLLNRCKSLSISAINPIDFIKELDK
jgi:predicted nucleic acid-binding protein